MSLSFNEVMQFLEQHGNPDTKRILINHGAQEPFFGVKIGDLKKIQKKIKVNHPLAQQLYATGNSDAMYFAGLIADPQQMTHAELNDWADKAYWSMLSEYTVAWLASEHEDGFNIALEWIESPQEHIAAAGWSALASIAAIKQDEQLDIPQFSALLKQAKEQVHSAQNRVRYTMNNFIISVAASILPLHKQATEYAKEIGKVKVFMGKTACKVPEAAPYIQKIVERGNLGKKRKSSRC